MSLGRLFGSNPEPTPPVVDADIDDAIHILNVARRRAVIRYVADTDHVLELRELARDIAAEELGKPAEDVSSTEYKRVYVQLYQSHLDEMERLCIIDYDDDRKTITAGEKIEGYLRLLEVIEARTKGATV